MTDIAIAAGVVAGSSCGVSVFALVRAALAGTARPPLDLQPVGETLRSAFVPSTDVPAEMAELLDRMN